LGRANNAHAPHLVEVDLLLQIRIPDLLVRIHNSVSRRCAVRAYAVGPVSPIPALIVPTIMFVVGFFLMKKFVFDLADEVWEDNDVLIVKNRGQEQRIALRDIKNVSYSPMMSPPRVILSLRRPTVFGGQIAFCAAVRFVPFATSPIVDDLIDRIDTARQGQA
jgi:hypothetical protein